MFRILESQAPAKQTATDTIDVLSNRLQSATLLEDRRAAIQGLRSFAKLYPASVASGGLRSLISSLRNDSEDVDTIKVVLETLLMLFTPDESSPEASDEIALWLADEFTQRQDNITTLLNLLEAREFYSRLYSLQLISHICSARPERTQECIFTAPLGISKLVSVLTDAREPVRNEALVLLIALTPASEELQKLVAFENAFEILFSLIEAEGALTHGTEVVEDCLSLLAQLLRFNVSNQSFFRETGCKTTSRHHNGLWSTEIRNVWGLLAIIQLFLIRGGMSTPINQTAFWQNGVTEQVLSIAFGQRFSVGVTSKALSTCADLIRGNSPLQERFGDIEVLWGSYPRGDKAVNGDANEPLRINVIEAFLKLSLEPAPNNLLDARLAACELWMACVLMFHLLFDDAEAKATAMAVTEGDAESGEEVVTSVQSVVGNLITGLQRGDDERITVGYLMLLCGWLFEDPDVVNDLLGEGSCIQTLLQEIKHQRAPSKLVPGLCTVLLGVIYEFSTKDSPIPRITLHKLLIEQLGREQYIDKITRLREFPLVRDFEVLPQTAGGQLEGGLPEVFFDRSFIEFLKDNFSRLLRAIDREPGFEISIVANGVEKGISRDLVDSLRAEIEDRTHTLQTLESDLVSIQRKLDQEQLDHRKTKESNAIELSKAQQSNQSLQQRHVQELSQQLSKLENEHKHHKNELLKQHSDQLRAIDHQLKQTSAESESKSNKAKELRKHHEREVAGLQQTIRGLESDLSRIQEQHTGEVVTLNKKLRELETIISQSNEAHGVQVADLQKNIQDLESSKKSHNDQVGLLNKKIQELQSTIRQSTEAHGGQVAGLENKIQDLENTKKANDRQVADLTKKIKDFESTNGTHDREVADLTKRLQGLESTLAAAKQNHEAEVSDYQSKVETLESTLSTTKQQYEAESTSHNNTVGTLESNLAAAKKEHEAEIATLKQSVAVLESDLTKAQKSSNDFETAQEDTASQTSALEARAKEAENKALEAESPRSIQAQLNKANTEVKEKEEARQSAQSELEDLLIVFGDLEAKRTEDKKRLKELGEEVSEAEDDDDDEDEDEEDE
ncbi:Armadillo-like helical [Penicillium expansum]|nr:Armadillo-like helical [Penicillium expansum]